MLFNETYTDATSQELSLPGWAQEYRQISAGRFLGFVQGAVFTELSILREKINVSTEQSFSAPADSLVFYSYLSPTDQEALVRGGSNGAPAGFTTDWRDRVSIMGQESDLLMVVLPKTLRPAYLRAGSFDCLGAAAEDARHFSDWLLSVLHALGDEKVSGIEKVSLHRLVPDLVQDRLTSLIRKSTTDPLTGVTHAEVVYRRMRDWLYAHREEVPTVAALARALMLSPEELRQACREFTGIPLDHILIRLRLNGARRALIQAKGDAKVYEIALDWGFMHWGRFAMRYKALFGQTPSQTLRGL